MVHTTTFATLAGATGLTTRDGQPSAASRLSKGQLRALCALHIEVAPALASALGPLLNGATVTLLSVEEAAGGAARAGEWEIGFSAETPRAGILRCSAAWVRLMLDHLLGMSEERMPATESPSALETHLLLRAAEPLLAAYAEGWAAYYPFIPTIDEAGAVREAGEPLYIATYEARTSRGAGAFAVELRLGAWQQALRKLGAPAETEAAPPPNPRLLSAIGDCPVTVRALLGSTSITVSDLLGLRDGDVICLDRHLDAPLEIRVGERPRLLGHAHLDGDRFLVTVAALVTEGDMP